MCQKKQEKEMFLDPIALKQIETEEDITPIKNGLQTYLTIYNKTSFPGTGKTWFNMGATSALQVDSNFSFDIAPVYNTKNGVYMGNNRLIGPLSSALNIQFNNTYTICMACKHGNLITADADNEIEIFKLYANSPNNNGMRLYILKDTIQNANNTQTGSLMFQYANLQPMPCVADKQTFMNLSKDLLTYYFIVKDTDNVKVLMMDQHSNVIVQILQFSTSNTDINFSNKEMVINRMVNWNGNMFTLAIYDSALTFDNISRFYVHFNGEYHKNIDPNFSTMIAQYNASLSQLASLTQCPYDKTVCDTCTTVKSWTDVNEIINSSATCKKSISDFCAINTTHSMCKCWDSTSAIYNTDGCKSYRSIFSGYSLNDLSASDLLLVKSKYGLVSSEECPKPTLIQTPIQTPIQTQPSSCQTNQTNQGDEIIKYYKNDPLLTSNSDPTQMPIILGVNQQQPPSPIPQYRADPSTSSGGFSGFLASLFG